MSNGILCIYHAGCLDGFTAAWCVWRAYPNAEFHPGVYNEPPPDVTGKRVVLVDFSYPYVTIMEMARAAQSIIILDHHATAKSALATFKEPPLDLEMDGRVLKGWLPNEGVWAKFDMNKSGARLAMEHFVSDDLLRNPLVHYVEDRDLWRFSSEDTKAICAYLFTQDFSFNNWDSLNAKLRDPETRSQIIETGSTLLEKHDKDVRKLVEMCAREARIYVGSALYQVPIASIPPMYASDAGNLMCQSSPFSATYYDTESYRVFSLRSAAGHGEDVSEIAKYFGGGGHKNAAGFKVTRDHYLATI